MTDRFFEMHFCHAALAVSTILLLHKQRLCKYKMRLEEIVYAQKISGGQHCAVAWVAMNSQPGLVNQSKTH